jgi:hypothetical protein
MTSTDNKKSTIIYVLTNSAMPGLVKIGKTTNLKKRIRDLSSPSGVPVSFELEYACQVKNSKCDEIEKALHTAFKPQRLNTGREFFRINPVQAIAILKVIKLENTKDITDITQKMASEINNEMTEEDKSTIEQLKPMRRPPLNFMEMGIAKHSILTYIKNPKIKVEVISDRKVEYKGTEMSLTAVVREIEQLNFNIQPTKYWEYNGKNLGDIYDETYPFEE